MIEGLAQLEVSDKCHNDLKPENILYKVSSETYHNGDAKIDLRFGDFGTEGRSGGTPGWTWPKFMTDRKSGKSDMYSIGLLILYTMCDEKIMFYRLRNNYIDYDPSWLETFRKVPLIKLVMEMMNTQITVKEAETKWEKISSNVDFITGHYLNSLGVETKCLMAQDDLDHFQLEGATYNEK